MKKFLKILIVCFFLIFAGALLYFFVGRSVGCLDNLRLTGIGLYKDHTYLKPKDLPNGQMVEIENDLRSWWSQSDSAWKPTFVTFIPGFVISTDKGNVNVLRESIIVNCDAGQFARSLSESEMAFFEKIKNRIPEWAKK